jgi:hypothetical protein
VHPAFQNSNDFEIIGKTNSLVSSGAGDWGM